MDESAIRRFMARDWDKKEEAKEAYWAQRFREEGPAATLAASAAMAAHIKTLRPDWPTEQDRAEDLRHHMELIDKLKRAAHAFSRR